MKKNDRLLITSTGNPRIKGIRSLRKRRSREEAGLILIEGVREVERALLSGLAPAELYVCPSIEDQGGDSLRALTGRLCEQGAAIFEVSAHVYEKIAYRGATEGVVAVAPRPSTTLPTRISRAGQTGSPLYLVVDGVEKPGNLGGIIRTADGAGVTGIIVSGGGVDIYSPNVIRASLGTVFDMEISAADSDEALSWLKKNGVDIITSTPAAPLLYHEADYTGACAIVVGSEDKGADSRYLDPSSVKVRIPMNGIADSLNVSVSASILVYEALRQRIARGGRR